MYDKFININPDKWEFHVFRRRVGLTPHFKKRKYFVTGYRPMHISPLTEFSQEANKKKHLKFLNSSIDTYFPSNYTLAETIQFEKLIRKGIIWDDLLIPELYKESQGCRKPCVDMQLLLTKEIQFYCDCEIYVVDEVLHITVCNDRHCWYPLRYPEIRRVLAKYLCTSVLVASENYAIGRCPFGCLKALMMLSDCFPMLNYYMNSTTTCLQEKLMQNDPYVIPWYRNRRKEVGCTSYTIPLCCNYSEDHSCDSNFQMCPELFVLNNISASD